MSESRAAPELGVNVDRVAARRTLLPSCRLPLGRALLLPLVRRSSTYLGAVYGDSVTSATGLVARTRYARVHRRRLAAAGTICSCFCNDDERGPTADLHLHREREYPVSKSATANEIRPRRAGTSILGNREISFLTRPRVSRFRSLASAAAAAVQLHSDRRGSREVRRARNRARSNLRVDEIFGKCRKGRTRASARSDLFACVKEKERERERDLRSRRTRAHAAIGDSGGSEIPGRLCVLAPVLGSVARRR